MSILGAANGRVHFKDGNAVDYARFGRGPRVLIMLPGVGDGLKTAEGMALPMAVLYRELAEDFTVYMISRRRELPPHFTTRQMARDVAHVMHVLGIGSACVLGVSQGGMIAEWLAIDYPEKVDKLILTVTTCRQNTVLREAIDGWMKMAERGDYRGIMTDTAQKSYSPARFKIMGPVYALMGNIGRPEDFDKPEGHGRFLTQAESCLTHDASCELGKIRCPVLVIGGKEDRIASGEASEEIHERIPGSELYLYDGLGHGLYEEAGDFLGRVKAFFG